MKKLLTVIPCILMLNISLRAQQTDSLFITLTEARCMMIDTYLSDKSAKVYDYEYDCPELVEGGIIHAHTYKGDTMMISANRSFGSHAGEEIHYYMYGRQLIFCTYEYAVWAFDPAYSGDSVAQTIDYFTLRYIYFRDDKAVHCLEKKYEIHSARKTNPSADEVPFQNIDCPDVSETLSAFYSFRRMISTNPPKIDCPFK